MSSNAATGLPEDVATTAKPVGASVTESPWLIHTFCSRSWSRRREDVASIAVSVVAPYSRTPVGATVPSRAAAIAWKP